MPSLDRRAFLIRSAGLLGGAVLGSPLLHGLGARQALAAAGKCLQAAQGEGGYGALNIGVHHPGEFAMLESWSGYERALPIPATA